MKHRCEVRQFNGRTMLYIDGAPVPLMTYQFMSSDPEITNNIPIVPTMDTDMQLRAMGSAGIRLYFIRIEIHSPEQLDDAFYKLAKSVRQLRSCVPDAYAVPWLLLCPYDEFCQKYPDDVQTFDDGSTGGYSGNLLGRIGDSSIPRHTHASQAWRHETAGVLRQLVRRIQAEPDLDDAVVGYFFFPLQHEANYFYDYDHSKKLDDYGAATRLAMRNYLAEKYMGSLEQLRHAWRDDSVTFETLSLPDRAARENGTAGLFWDPAKSQPVMDYAEVRSHVWADTLEYFARACKEETDYRALVGSFWGYLIHNDPLWGGQGYYRRMMDSPYLDFWASPFTYVNKNSGMSVTIRQLQQSIMKHGKLFFSEVDTTTTTSDPTQLWRQGMHIDDPSLDGDVLKREFVYTLTEGMHGWWIDWPSGTAQYDEEKLLPLMRRMQEIGQESLEKPMGSVAQIAALVSQEGIFSAPNTYSNITQCAIEYPRIFELPYLGAPVDHYELRDVLDAHLKHRMYIFQNAYLLDEGERAAIARLRSPERMLVFMYAQGFLSPENPTADVENISRLTGIRLRQTDAISSCRIVLTDQAALLGLTPGDEVGEYEKMITGEMRYDGTPIPVQTQVPDPVFVADDPDAVVLGVYKENGLPAFVMKEVDGCRVLYYGSTALNTRVLRGLCRLQGLTLYTQEDCIIYANESYLGLHAVRDGAVTLHLPTPRAMQEMFSGEKFSATAELTLTLRKGETRLFSYVD